MWTAPTWATAPKAWLSLRTLSCPDRPGAHAVLGGEEMAKLTNGGLSWRRWPASLWPGSGEGHMCARQPIRGHQGRCEAEGTEAGKAGEGRILGREPGRSPGPGSGPQQEPRQMARIKQSMDSQVHGQACTQQPTQTAGPGSHASCCASPTRRPHLSAGHCGHGAGGQLCRCPRPAACMLPPRCPSRELAGLAIGPSHL